MGKKLKNKVNKEFGISYFQTGTLYANKCVRNLPPPFVL